MTISVHGIGWLTAEGYGCVRCGQRETLQKGEGTVSLPKKGIFSHPFKNFGRLDRVSRITSYAVALALRDAGIEYSPLQKQDIGIIATSIEGSLRTDIEYFTDYIKSGRTLSRGNLFIYTLPSSPLGEAAIHFGFLGPLLYAAGKDHSLVPLLDTAFEMIMHNEASIMLAGKTGENQAIFFVLAKDAGREHTVLCRISDARSVAESCPDVTEAVGKFALCKQER